MSLLIDLGEDRAAELINKINDWRQTSRTADQLETDINELFDLFGEMDKIKGENRNRKIEEVVDLETVRTAPRFEDQVADLNERGAKILACDHYGDCLVSWYPEADFYTGHIDDIEEALQAAQEAV